MSSAIIESTTVSSIAGSLTTGVAVPDASPLPIEEFRALAEVHGIEADDADALYRQAYNSGFAEDGLPGAAQALMNLIAGLEGISGDRQ